MLLITAVSALGGLLFGYDTGVINGAQFYLSKHFDLDSAMKGWVVGSALLGCLVGAIFAGPFSIKFGRKYSLIISAVLFSISAYGSGLPSMFSESVSLLVVFRIIGGLGIGIASMNAPMYIAEITPARKRGRMVAVVQVWSLRSRYGRCAPGMITFCGPGLIGAEWVGKALFTVI